jgi:hypothetical protein
VDRPLRKKPIGTLTFPDGPEKNKEPQSECRYNTGSRDSARAKAIIEDKTMSNKELLIQQICELDETANPRFLDAQSEEELQEYYDCLVQVEEAELVGNSVD